MTTTYEARLEDAFSTDLSVKQIEYQARSLLPGANVTNVTIYAHTHTASAYVQFTLKTEMDLDDIIDSLRSQYLLTTPTGHPALMRKVWSPEKRDFTFTPA